MRSSVKERKENCTGLVPLSLSVPLFTPASTDSSPVPPENTSEPHASTSARESVKDFRIVYTHRQKVSASESVLVNPSPIDGPPTEPSAPPSDLDVLIGLRIGKWSCTDHILNFVSYDHLNPQFHQFALFLSSVSILKSCKKDLLVPTWKQAMNEEMDTLVSREI